MPPKLRESTQSYRDWTYRATMPEITISGIFARVPELYFTDTNGTDDPGTIVVGSTPFQRSACTSVTRFGLVPSALARASIAAASASPVILMLEALASPFSRVASAFACALVVDPDRVLPLATARQSLKTVAWGRPQVAEIARGAEVTQFPALEPLDELCEISHNTSWFEGLTSRGRLSGAEPRRPTLWRFPRPHSERWAMRCFWR